jgi:predicted amidophosphoribosyltransferase
MMGETPRHRVCARCGATNFGVQTICLRCRAPLGEEAELKFVRTCPRCGSPVAQGKRFCPQCGANLLAEQAQVPLICPECGSPITPGKKFCTQCGARLPRAAGH